METVGVMTLNRLVDNFFTEEEHSVFDPAHVVPGIDFTNDPVLQGRAFAYRDTELHRQRSANFNSLPVNRPLVERNFNIRDSAQRYRIDVDSVHFHRNSLAGNTPGQASQEEGGYVNYPEKVEGHATRDVPSESFEDFYSQPRIFFHSLSKQEKKDLIKNFCFHLGQVDSKSVREQNVEMWSNVDYEMARLIADHIGVAKPPKKELPTPETYPSLSQMNTPFLAATQKVGIVIGDGFSASEVLGVLNAFKANEVFYDVISDNLGPITASDGSQIEANKTFTTTYPILYDTVYLVGGRVKIQNLMNQEIQAYFKSAYKYFKPIGVARGAEAYLRAPQQNNLKGVVFADQTEEFNRTFIQAIAKQRFWDRT